MSISIVILKSLPHDNKRMLLWQELTFILMMPIDIKIDLEELKILAKDYFRFLLEDTAIRMLNKRSIIEEIYANLASIDKTNLKSGEQNKK